jgi:hypothetical protein
MKVVARTKQVQIIRNIQQHLKGYLLWKKCKSKAAFFQRSDLENHIFHLKMIIDITEEPKIAKKASQLLKLFKRILKYEYDETPFSNISDMTKCRRAGPSQNGS